MNLGTRVSVGFFALLAAASLCAVLVHETVRIPAPGEAWAAASLPA